MRFPKRMKAKVSQSHNREADIVARRQTAAALRLWFQDVGLQFCFLVGFELGLEDMTCESFFLFLGVMDKYVFFIYLE